MGGLRIQLRMVATESAQGRWTAANDRWHPGYTALARQRNLVSEWQLVNADACCSQHWRTHQRIPQLHLDVGVLLLEVATTAGDGAAGAHAADQDVDLATSGFPDLRAGGAVVHLYQDKDKTQILCRKRQDVVKVPESGQKGTIAAT